MIELFKEPWIWLVIYAIVVWRITHRPVPRDFCGNPIEPCEKHGVDQTEIRQEIDLFFKTHKQGFANQKQEE